MSCVYISKEAIKWHLKKRFKKTYSIYSKKHLVAHITTLVVEAAEIKPASIRKPLKEKRSGDGWW